MIGVLARVLERFGRLSEAERRAVEGAEIVLRTIEADRDLMREGEYPSHAMAVLDGVACRYKLLEGGRRQITAFHLPGELCDLAGLFLGEPGHGVCTLTPARVAFVPRATVLGWTRQHPGLNEALWRAASIEATVSREWTVNLGRRMAYPRTAHLLCELAFRLRVAGLAQGACCGVAFTPTVLADALGLTPVHVGRTLQQLRAAGLVEVGDGVLSVLDWRGLVRVADFDAVYLHRLVEAE